MFVCAATSGFSTPWWTFFGSVPQYTQPNSQGLTEITMSIAAEGVKLFALQYADNVELLEPQWLREKSEIP